MRKTPHVFIQKFIIPKEIFHLKKEAFAFIISSTVRK